MRRGEGSGRSRMGRKRRDKNAADNPVESLEGKRIIGFGRGNGPLHDADMVAVHEAALALLANTGLAKLRQLLLILSWPLAAGLIRVAGYYFHRIW